MYIYNERNELVSLDEATQRAQRAYDSGKDRLYRPDGTPKYSEPEMAERLEALQSEREEALKPYAEAAQRDVERHTRELQAIAGQDPAASLTTEELQRASALEPYVSERLSQAPSGPLLDALRAAADSGDKASVFVHLRLGEKALREQGDRIPAFHRATGDTLLEELRNVLGAGEREEKREQAQRRLEEAEKRTQRARLATTGSSNLYQHLYKS